LDNLLPYGLLATRKWLLAQGVSSHALDNALKSQRLRKQGVGVYSRSDSPLGWQALVCSLQRISDRPVLVGGLTALQVLGFAQYLPIGEFHQVHLYGVGRVPAWLNRVPAKASYHWHGVQGVWPDQVLEEALYRQDHQWRDDLPPIRISCAEKAFLEMLAGLPRTVSFDHADELMQGMTSLSPRKLDELLKACRSIKAKRLFLWLAHRHNYPWSRKLDEDDYDLGKGKRVIAKQGKLDSRYLITVPEHLRGSK
jgi:hypothetical protein